MVKNSDFKLYNMSTDLYNYLRVNIVYCIPKIHNDLRIHLLDESYNLIKCIVSASFTKGNVRNKYVNDSLITISMLDALLSIVMNIDSIDKKKVSTSIGQLANIKNIIYAWKNKLNDNEKGSN